MWEYEVCESYYCHADGMLAARGADGWELVAVGQGYFFFKKKVE